MAQLVPGTPTQGALYHRLTTLIAANYSGLGPQNVQTATYAPMVGRSFQKPLSGSVSMPTTVPSNKFR